jgi:uncharacterized protein YjbI with pentapeptide repeats
MRRIPGDIKRAGLLILCIMAAGAAPEPAWAQDVPRHPANVSVFYPIGTNQDPSILTHFRLSLFYGRVGYIKGFDAGAVVSRTDRDLRGVQLTGVYSQTGHDLRGAAVAGGINYVGGNVTGVQFAGLVNFDRGDFTGLQSAVLFNFVDRDFSGVQMTSLFNLNNSDAKYVQLSGTANLVAGSFKGVQVAGFLNYTNERLGGVQLGLTNLSAELHGAQVGVFNIAGEANGAQIGFVNWTRRIEGAPVGVINLTEQAAARWSTYFSNVALVSTGVRTVVHRYCSTLALGVGDVEQERDDTVFLSWYYGYMFPLGEAEKWWITPQFGYVHVMPQSSEEGKINNLHFDLQALATGEVRFAKIARLFLGAGVNWQFSEYSTKASVNTDPLIIAGISIW